ncbi:MAG: RsbRD N-terminal domain-containing protein [Desulfobacterales bacterium]|nr:RsbRD N-terminal domain-containing protein [Desulfobacterales bacterium]
MKLGNILSQKKSTIVKKWFDSVAKTYAEDTAKFLKNQADPFANPVGGSLSTGLEALMDELIQGMHRETIVSFLDPIIRIRAVQAFTPSKATAFIFKLKQVIRQSIAGELKEKEIADELLTFEIKIDELALIAFDIYVECREKIYELQANEMKNRTYSAFKRANLVSEIE